MTGKFNIAGYSRISVDDDLDRDNTSIENQKSIIEDYVKHHFFDSKLDFYEDRDRSGYTFEQREGYQQLRPLLMSHQYDILIVKDFSRFSRRNSRGLVELEDLRDVGVRIISIGDSIDYPTYDDWTAIQFRFLVNEMPVTDASKKVKSVIKRRQEDGRWICAVPYGYVITNTKTMAFEISESEAEIVRKIYELYNQGWGYKRISNYLTDLHIPTPRMNERARKEAKGEDCKLKTRNEWSIITIQGILSNDFYIGTLRQGKYNRKKINGVDIKLDESDHIVFENNHDPIVDFRTFSATQEGLKKRTTDHYRGIKKNDNVYSGFLVCGDCNSPMFAMGRTDLRDAYRCGKYHRRGLSGCTSHHIRVDMLDTVLKNYLRYISEISADMITQLEESIKNESEAVKNNQQTVDIFEKHLDDAKEELKVLIRQKARELMRKPESEDIIEETYEELIAECRRRIEGLQNQIALTFDKRNTIIRVNRIAKTTISIFDEVLQKEKLDKQDLELIIDKIYIYEDHIEVKLKADIDSLFRCGELTEETVVNFNSGIVDILQTQLIQCSPKHSDKVYDVNVISSGDPLEIYTDREGEVIFKKYSPIGELGSFASQYADTLHKTCDLSIVICDRDAVIACSGLPKKDFLEKRLSPDMESVIESRNMYTAKSTDKHIFITDDSGSGYVASCIMPIITEGDVTGCVASLIPEGSAVNMNVSDTEQKLVQTAALFLGRQLEQ